MGIIRLLLALSVVSGHLQFSSLGVGTTGQVSVQAFFLISGFYISMALCASYSRQVPQFWLNRALRLYPAYLLVAAAALVFEIASVPGFISAFASLPASATAILVLSNVLLFGQDWVMFLGVQHGSLHFFKSFTDSSPQLWTLLLVPPAWSLGVELTFYLLAPFVLRLATPALVGIIVLSVILRAVLFKLGLHLDPWSYRFFPTELALFLAGAVAYRTGASLRRGLPFAFSYGLPAAVFIVALIVAFRFVPGPWWVTNSMLYGCLALCLPLIFDRFKHSRVDRFIGDLSYPLYICHWLVIMIMRDLLGVPKTLGAALLVVGASVLVAIGLCLTVDRPLQRLRAKVRGAKSEPRMAGLSDETADSRPIRGAAPIGSDA